MSCQMLLRLVSLSAAILFLAGCDGTEPTSRPSLEDWAPFSLANSLCESAFSSPVSEDSAIPGVLALINKEYEEKVPYENEWELVDSLGLDSIIPGIGATSQAEMHSLVCIRESREQVATYRLYTNAPHGSPAYVLKWDVRLVQWPDGKVLAVNNFRGGEPPDHITTDKTSGYGNPPLEDLIDWLIILMGEGNVLYHDGSIRSIAFSPNGQILAVAYSNKVLLWDVATGQDRIVLEGYGAEVAFSPDGKLVAAGRSDKTIRLLDAATGQEMLTFAGHTGDIRSITFSPDGRFLASASDDTTVKLWNVSTGQIMYTLEEHKGSVLSVAFSPNGQFLASGGADNRVVLWNVAVGERLRVLKGHRASVTSVTFSPDGQYLASASNDDTVVLWNVARWRQLHRFEGHDWWVSSVAFSLDGKLLASGSFDGTVKLWDVEGHQEVCTLYQTSWVKDVVFSPDGKSLASGNSDGAVRLWDTGTDH